jgi:hypothetical protein
VAELEDRTLPSNFSAASVSALIADINAANAAGGANTIQLTAPAASPYDLNAVNNATDGPTGLPVVSGGGKKVAADNLTIIGNGDTIERSSASGTPAFRLFEVAGGASLTLESVTLQNGLAFGSGAAARGGAAYNQGALVLSGVTVQDNEAEAGNGADAAKGKNGGNGQVAAGGGIWSGGSLTLKNCTLVQNNEALGGNGGAAYEQYVPLRTWPGGNGGDGSGGGVYVAGGTANLAGGTLSGNVAEGGLAGAGVPGSIADTYIDGGYGGVGSGGGLCVAAGTGALTGVTVDSNQAIPNKQPPPPGAQNGGEGQAGGVCVLGGTATLSNDTVDSNMATGDGGGLGLFGGSVTLPGDTVDSNTAGYGGGVAAWGPGTTVSMCNVTVQANAAGAMGGGIWIVSGSYEPTVYLDSLTVANTINNTDPSGLNGPSANIYGPYVLQNC